MKEYVRDQQVGHEVRKNRALLSQLNKIIHFFRTVVCELILRDLEALLHRYLSKTAKAFGQVPMLPTAAAASNA